MKNNFSSVEWYWYQNKCLTQYFECDLTILVSPSCRQPLILNLNFEMLSTDTSYSERFEKEKYYFVFVIPLKMWNF